MSERLIPLRCLCGNAVRRPALEHEDLAKEVVTSLCPECDDGGRFEEIFYTAADGREMCFGEWMDFVEAATPRDRDGGG